MWWLIIGFILVGIIFMLVEFLLIPGIGVAGFLSLSSFVASSWFAFTTVSDTAGWWISSINLVLLVVLLIIMLREKTWKKFGLKTEIDSKVNQEVEKVQVGNKGVAQTRLAPIGTGRFGNIVCEVKSADNSMVDALTEIEIIEIRDNQILVTSVK